MFRTSNSSELKFKDVIFEQEKENLSSQTLNTDRTTEIINK